MSPRSVFCLFSIPNLLFSKSKKVSKKCLGQTFFNTEILRLFLKKVQLVGLITECRRWPLASLLHQICELTI